MSFYRWMQRREHGLPGQYGDGDFLQKRVYKSIGQFYQWNNTIDKQCAVFNFEFNPQGNILVAACEKKTILLFDAITTKNTFRIAEAHTDNVNCIKFLDDHIFASCSDDTTVALWDLRYLKSKLRSLHGHSNWVKNIEYSHKDRLLVTSGFDGSIFTWDINSHTEHGLIYQKVFHTSGLMRCRIAPDSSKLIICTTGGYLMIIHNLDLTTLHKDLCGFRPGIYRLMQTGNQYIPQAAKFDHVFSKKQKKNRVEFVTDFPEKNDAEVILALQIHPQGHSFLSRNISYDEHTEWSCVHDIKEEPGDITEQIKELNTKRKRKLISESDDDEHRNRNTINDGDIDDMLLTINRRHRNQRLRTPGRSTASPSVTGMPATGSNNDNIQPTNRNESFVPDIWAAEVTVQERAIRQSRARNSNSVTGYSFVYAISSGVLPAGALTTRAQNSRNGTSVANTERDRNTASVGNNNASTNDAGNMTSSSSSGSSSSSSSSSTSSNDSPPHLSFERRIRMGSLMSPIRKRERIFENPKKLMYYIEESNIGKGFIKEPCFSSDGRIICSPYDSGVRLLAFDENCVAYPHQRTRDCSPRPLYVLKEIKSHWDIVLSSKFSPREPLLVTGCRAGNIIWHHPIL